MVVPPAVAFFVAAALTPSLAYWARRRNLLDVPNERSSHVVATPRIGGAAFVLALLAGMGAAWVANGISTTAMIVVATACAVATVGFIDDLRSLPAGVRLVFHLTVSIVLTSIAGGIALPGAAPAVVAFVVTVIWMTAVTNAFNFMDGIDGIAGGQAVVAAVGWAVVGGLLGAIEVVVLAVVIAAAVTGFLLHNWPPAKVFMGDAGSGF